ncbi:MAG: recombinase family protein, partial [Pirellulales bacterium]|nr:recombinase family protein [Pirellulales bacterium]
MPDHNTLIPAVGYIRMSTDKQEDSPARQRKDIETLAQRQGYQITDWFEDHGMTGTESAKREDFQRLMKLAKSGKFKAVLLSEQSRMSREDVFDAIEHWRVFRDAGVSIVTAQRGSLDFNNLGGVITAIVDQHGAHEESVKIAHRVASGQRMKAKAGQRIGGIAIGYDREIYDEQGKMIRKVGYRERFRKPISWQSKLVPTDNKEIIKLIQWAYDAILNGLSLSAIAAEFNRRKIATTYGNNFSVSVVGDMLRNPVYAGILCVGRWPRGKFSTVATEGLIVVEDAHEAIVPRSTFEQVQEIINQRKSLITMRHPQSYLLSGFLFCANCGIKMYGAKLDSNEESQRVYRCNPNKHVRPYSPNCPHPSVDSDKLNNFVLSLIRKILIEPDHEALIRKAIIRLKHKHVTKVNQDEIRLAELNRKIKVATENMVLAETKEDMKVYKEMLDQWKFEVQQINDTNARQADELKPLPQALSAL